MMREYETVIGLEVHVELATKSKIFCGCSTAFGGAVNTHTCPVCTGMPGTLPVLNKKVVEYAIAVGLATNCDITKHCTFDRKNYFYPDNPQNYQISQLYMPICKNGWVTILVDGVEKKIGIHEIHMEEDAGKLIHDTKTGNTLIDYNRSGVPLIEIVSKPDMRSASEVIAYLEKLRMLIQYLGVSDCKLQEGSMRADVNLSIREKGTSKLGIRTEMKNLNSFREITRAIRYESERQIQVLESGNPVVQETRRWDDDKGETFSMRSKEDASDYRYFPEPDLMPIVISQRWIEEIKSRQPEFQEEKRKRYAADFAIPEYDINIITNDKKLADLFEETVALGVTPKTVSNWLMGETQRLMKQEQVDACDLRFSANNLAKLIQLVEKKVINGNVAKDIFEVVFRENRDPEQYVKDHSLEVVTDEGELQNTCTLVLQENQKAVCDYLNGKEKALGALVGQTMKKMQGKADHNKVKEMLVSLLKSLDEGSET